MLQTFLLISLHYFIIFSYKSFYTLLSELSSSWETKLGYNKAAGCYSDQCKINL